MEVARGLVVPTAQCGARRRPRKGRERPQGVFLGQVAGRALRPKDNCATSSLVGRRARAADRAQAAKLLAQVQGPWATYRLALVSAPHKRWAGSGWVAGSLSQVGLPRGPSPERQKRCRRGQESKEQILYAIEGL